MTKGTSSRWLRSGGFVWILFSWAIAVNGRGPDESLKIGLETYSYAFILDIVCGKVSCVCMNFNRFWFCLGL